MRPVTLAPPVFEPMGQPPPLRPGEVHLWMAQLDETPPGQDLPLPPDERLRAERFHHEIDRQRYVASRTVLRHLLAPYAEIAPRSLLFMRSEFGKPSLPGTMLRFNLSHSENLMLLAITHGREIGVDLESVRENLSFEVLSDHYFPPEDQWQLRITPEPQRRVKFFEIWTRIEAQLKARGLGLGESLDFEDADRFSVHSFLPAAGFAAALAVEGGDFNLSCWQWLK